MEWTTFEHFHIVLGLQVQLVQWKLNLQPCRCCLCPPKRFSLWLLGQFWGSLAIKEDKFGLFGSLDTSNGAQNNYLTPVWSLIQMYLFLSQPFCFFLKKKNLLHLNEKSSLFIWCIIYFCNMYGFFRILEKTSSKLICTWLYLHNSLSEFTMVNFQF